MGKKRKGAKRPRLAGSGPVSPDAIDAVMVDSADQVAIAMAEDLAGGGTVILIPLRGAVLECVLEPGIGRAAVWAKVSAHMDFINEQLGYSVISVSWMSSDCTRSGSMDEMKYTESIARARAELRLRESTCGVARQCNEVS